LPTKAWRYDKILKSSAAPRAAMRFNGVLVLRVARAGFAAIFYLAR
jgi:hypothetical protein